MPNYEELDRKFPSQSHKFDRFREEYERLKHLDGDFAEFGVCNGNGARDLSRLDPTRKVYAFDTFCGMPSVGYNPEEDFSDPPGKWKPAGTPLELFDGIPNIIPIVGEFRYTLPAMPEELRFLLVHIDCDWYESHRMVLDFIQPRMTRGGVIIFDDVGLKGASRAISEWLDRVNRPRAARTVDDRVVWYG